MCVALVAGNTLYSDKAGKVGVFIPLWVYCVNIRYSILKLLLATSTSTLLFFHRFSNAPVNILENYLVIGFEVKNRGCL